MDHAAVPGLHHILLAMLELLSNFVEIRQGSLFVVIQLKAVSCV